MTERVPIHRAPSPSLVSTMTVRFGTARVRRATMFGVVMLSLVLQPRSLRPYMQDPVFLRSVAVFPNEIDDPSCHPPAAQGLVDWIDEQGNITKKKQLKLLSNIPRIHQIPVDYDIDLLQRNDEKDYYDEYSALSFHDYQFALLGNNVSSVPLSEFVTDQSWEEVSASLSRVAVELSTIYCRIRNQRVWFLHHFPHFNQQFFPCWSILHALLDEPIVSSPDRTKSWKTTKGKQFYIVLPESFQVSRGSYIDSLLQLITSRFDVSTPTISIVYGNATLPPTTEEDSPSTVNLLIESTSSEGGWGFPVKYFMATHGADIPSYFFGVPHLQRLVLGNDLQLDSTLSTISFLQVLILDRIGSTRTIAFVSEIRMLLEEATFTIRPDHCDDTARMVRMFNQNDPSDIQMIRFNVTYISSFTGWTVQDQARAMHQADIILSPHGAQLANAIYIRPCTVVLELYPYAYYVPFFPSLVRSAAGIPFVAYPKCYDRYSDRNRTMRDASYRVKVRSVPLFISPHSIAGNMLPMVQSYIQCRCKRQKM